MRDVTCPGCDKKFYSASKLMEHVENHKCPIITLDLLAEHRQKAVDFHDALQKLNQDDQDVSDGTYKGDGAAPYNKTDRNYQVFVRNEDFPRWNREYTSMYSPSSGIDKDGKDWRGHVVDPAKPGFDASVFYCQTLKTFKCPHKFCK